MSHQHEPEEANQKDVVRELLRQAMQGAAPPVPPTDEEYTAALAEQQEFERGEEHAAAKATAYERFHQQVAGTSDAELRFRQHEAMLRAEDTQFALDAINAELAKRSSAG